MNMCFQAVVFTVLDMQWVFLLLHSNNQLTVAAALLGGLFDFLVGATGSD